MKKNIIFDLGNVLIEWNIDKVLNGITKNNDSIKKILKKEIFDSGIWEDMDIGKFSVSEAEKIVNRSIEEKYHSFTREIFWNWYNYVDTNEELYLVIKKLYQEGYKIFVLSNTSELYYKVLDEKLHSIKEYISGSLLSYEEGLKKPDRKIYLRLLTKFNLKAEECIFFDDLSENVEEAKKCGISAYTYKKYMDIEKFIQL